ncbi:DUF6624 domain-containing protein [Marinactinospora thermotolerans]|uniref:DUF6624 domain-containing protein n=1 Tax=Marinactinospora thermotolerans TaxID=531310 RepID=UPI003D943ADA
MRTTESLRAELLDRARRDHRAREALPAGYTMRDRARLVAPVDEDNHAWLRELVAAHGWPGRSSAGDDGAEAAWLLAQHAPPEDQERFLPLLRRAVENGDAAPVHLAYLEDRVRVRRGLPQRYGTQYRRLPDGGLRLEEVEDPSGLDERRASAGLGPQAEYDARLRASASA